MARFADLPEALQKHLLHLECLPFETMPWTGGPPLRERRVAIVSTAGLQLRGEHPFNPDSADYRVIPGDAAPGDIVMSHASVNFDRTGFEEDVNVVFPLSRLRELAADGVIGSVGDFHYSFMGRTDPREMEPAARRLAELLKKDNVDSVLLVPV